MLTTVKKKRITWEIEILEYPLNIFYVKIGNKKLFFITSVFFLFLLKKASLAKKAPAKKAPAKKAPAKKAPAKKK